MKLDKSKSYGEVCGAGAKWRYEQGGKYFNGLGDEVDQYGRPMAEVLTHVGPAAADDVLDNLSWHEVKKLVFKSGGTWTNRIDGIRFLRAQWSGEDYAETPPAESSDG